MCAVRQELEAWGSQQPALPLLVEKPGRTQAEEPRQWHGQSVWRQGEVEYKDGRVTPERLRFVDVHARQLAQQHAQSYAAGQAKEAEALVDHVRQGQARWCACEADSAASLAEYEHRGSGRRGRRPQAWRYHTVRYRVMADTRLIFLFQRSISMKFQTVPREQATSLARAGRIPEETQKQLLEMIQALTSDGG